MIQFLLAAPRSGSGKTTMTCALLMALKRRGCAPCAFKNGPDYIDPMFHRAVLGVESRNLDLFFSAPETVRTLYAKGAAGHGAAVCEGAMGFYAGLGGVSDRASAWHLADTLDLPVLLGNDADCAAVGEYFQGAGRGLRDFVVLTLGTGLGAGIILDGRLRGGESSSEAGHMVLHAGGEPCPCGRRGCWEQYASATALIRRTEAAMAAHPESALCRLAEEAGGVDGRTPFLAAEAGDETALAVCRAYVEELAEGTASLINILRPEAVASGGGVAGAPEHLLLEPLRRRVGALCFSRHGGRATRILRAELGNDAGVIGAALLGRVI